MSAFLAMCVADLERRYAEYMGLRAQAGFLRGQIKTLEIQIKTTQKLIAERATSSSENTP